MVGRHKNAVLPISYALRVAAVCLMPSYTLAQQPLPPRPELENVVYFFESSEHALKPLPAEKGKLLEKGFYRIRSLIQIPGRASSFRLKAGSELVFTIKCSNPGALSLYAFTVKSKTREAVILGAKFSIRSGPEIEPPYGLKFFLTEYGDSTYKVAIRSPEPGEYGFALRVRQVPPCRAPCWDVAVFDFAVDAQ